MNISKIFIINKNTIIRIIIHFENGKIHYSYIRKDCKETNIILEQNFRTKL